MRKETLLKIGDFCRNYRKNYLNMTLTEFCEATNNNVKNVSAFENGRANNISYLISYWKLTDNEENRVAFLTGIFECN